MANTIVRLGVSSVPYSLVLKKTQLTTTQVAKILEAKYHIIRIFAEQNNRKISRVVEETASRELSKIVINGKPVAKNIKSIATSEISPILSEGFKRFLDSNGTGILTKAAVRRAHGQGKKRNQGISFIDTGLYRSAFRAWVEKT